MLVPSCGERKARRLLATASLVLLGFATSDCNCNERPITAAELENTRVVIIGVDGAAHRVIGPMIDRGELPTMARLMLEGAYLPQFEVVSPDSPLAWTSMATSRTPEDHGIVSYTTELPNGKLVPVASTDRKVHALWEVATQNAISVGTVGWWASWPAEIVKGYVVTDHANPVYLEAVYKDGRYWTADPDELRKMNRDFYPQDLAPLLQETTTLKDEMSYDDLQRRMKLSAAQLKILKKAPWHERTYYSLLKGSFLKDLNVVSFATALVRQRPTKLTMIYLRGPDAVQHYAWDLVEPERYRVPPKFLARDRGIVEGVYRAVDTFLQEILTSVGENAWVMVGSDHGAEPAPAATGIRRRSRPGRHSSAAKGVFFLKGPHIKKGYRIQSASPYDVMPTALWLLGLPISDDLEGKILKEAFDPGLVRLIGENRVPTYGTRETSAPRPSAVDDVMLKNLQALGYIQ